MQGDLVADFFCGSGTTLAVAEKLGRRWIGCDLGRWAIHVTRKRLLGIEDCKPFEVLNLGKYERQYWQGVTFGEAKDKPLAEQALYEYLAFILKLYGAQPVAGMAHLHGKKGKAMVHIGAVDAPVTIAEIDAAVDECAKLKQGELHVLGWEWEMGLYDLMVEAAKKKGVKLLLLQIPREVMEQQAAAKGDVRFFELAYLEAEIKQPKKLTAQVALKDFVIPNTELIPEDVRSKVKKWSDYIDYWAVDWDFQNDTFMQGWVAYRTRKERKLPLSLRRAHLREAGQVPHPGQGDRHLRQRHLAGLRRGGEVAMAKAVIAYDKDLPEIPGRRPWEKPDLVPGEGRRGADGLAGGRRPAAARASCCWCRRSARRWMPGASGATRARPTSRGDCSSTGSTRTTRSPASACPSATTSASARRSRRWSGWSRSPASATRRS